MKLRTPIVSLNYTDPRDRLVHATSSLVLMDLREAEKPRAAIRVQRPCSNDSIVGCKYKLQLADPGLSTSLAMASRSLVAARFDPLPPRLAEILGCISQWKFRD
jgi:hypothetical protein